MQKYFTPILLHIRTTKKNAKNYHLTKISEFYYVGNELRLADYVLDENAKTFSGRLELFYNGQWGTVCSTGFDQIDAQAVCNTIGFK